VRVKLLVLSLGLGLLGLGGLGAGRYFYARYQFRAAEQAAARYDFDEAERRLAAGLGVHPGSAALHLRMARVARRATHYDLAAEHLRECQRLEGKNSDNALEALLLQAQIGDIADVENLLLEQVADGSPDANLILEALARGYIHIYHLDAAMGCLNRLLEREPDNVSALLLRASLWNTAGNYDGALEDCRRAVEAQPEHRVARLRLGEALLTSKQPEEALLQFEYLRQRPGGDTADVLVGVARSHRQLGHAEEARQVLDELLARDPAHGSALVERGKIALDSESPAEAEKWLRRVVADYPFDAQANYLLAQALRKQGREDEASPYEAARTRIERDRKALDEAFRQVLKEPRNPAPRLQAGLICMRNGRSDEGERWLLSALEQAPDHAPTREALATFYERTGKVELAARYRQIGARSVSEGDVNPR